MLESECVKKRQPFYTVGGNKTATTTMKNRRIGRFLKKTKNRATIWFSCNKFNKDYKNGPHQRKKKGKEILGVFSPAF